MAEVLSKLTDRGAYVSRLADDLIAAGVLVEPPHGGGRRGPVAGLRRIDEGRLLSLGDRHRLALGTGKQCLY